MNITDIAMTPLWLPFKEPYRWAGRVDYGAAVVLIEVFTDEGLVGIGSRPRRSRSRYDRGAEGANTLLIGEPVFDVERLVTEARFLGSFNHTPRAANLALAGLEMALWDILGKAAGWPVYRLLGLDARRVAYFGFVRVTRQRARGRRP